jgi:2-polyprenyl-6-methoxyphenol hydroxylase-like FAD-dependent oxidoreductase
VFTNEPQVPDDRYHAGRILTAFEDTLGQPVRASFADGTHVECDILIGADGLTSAVRDHLDRTSPLSAAQVPAQR